MKKILSFLLAIIGLCGYSQDEYYRKVDWKFYPDNVVQLTDSTYLTDAIPFDYNDVGAIQRVVGNYVVDFVGHRYSVIDSTATTITVLDIYHTGQALQTGQIARCYRSVGDGEAEYIGSIDYSPLDESSRWKLNGSDNELLWRQTIGKAENGLYKDLRTAKLGGNLIEPTTIDQDNNSFKILNNGHGSVFSETGIAYTKIDTVDFTDSTLVTKKYVKSLIKEDTDHDSLTIAPGSTPYFEVNYPQIFSGQKLIDSLGVINTKIAGKEPILTKGNLTAGSSKVTIGGTGTGAVIGAGASIDVNEANIVHQNISGHGTNTHAQIDTHITNDADLSPANEFNTSVVFNKTNNKIEITDAGGTKSDTIEINLTKGNLTAGSSKVTIGGTGTGAVIGAGASVDVNEANIVHQNISGSGTNTHTQIDTDLTRLANTSGTNTGDQTLSSLGAAPASGSANYVQVSPDSAQSGNIWMDGTITSSLNKTNTHLLTQTTLGFNSLVPSENGRYSTFANNIANAPHNDWCFIENYGAFAGSYGIQIAYPLSYGYEGDDRNTIWRRQKFGGDYFGNWIKIYDSSNSNRDDVPWNASQYKLSGVDLFSSLTTGYLPYWDGSKLANSYLRMNTPLARIEISEFASNSIYVAGSLESGAYNFSLHQNYAEEAFRLKVGGSTILKTSGYNLPTAVFLGVHGNENVVKLTNNNVALSSLSGTGTRLVSASSDGTLANISNASGYLYNDGTGEMIFNNLTDTFAPASGSANYVQVSPLVPQSGNIWMDGQIKQTTGNGTITKWVDSNPNFGVDFDNERDIYGYYAIYSINNGNRTIGLMQGWGATALGNVSIGYEFGSEIQNNKLAVNGNAFFNGFTNASSYKLSGVDLFGSLTTGYLPYWDGSKLANSRIRIENLTNTIIEKNLSIWYKTDASEGAAPIIIPSSTDRGFKIIEGFGTGDFIEFLDDRRVKIQTLSGTGTRLVSASSDGTLANITNASGYLYNDGTNMSWIKTSPQSLSGTTPSLNASNGVNANLSISGATTLTLSNLISGTSGTIYLTNNASVYRIKIAGYTIAPASNITYDSTGILLPTSSVYTHTSIGWYYNGTTVQIHKADYNTTTY